jgi:toxoflavin synthase
MSQIKSETPQSTTSTQYNNLVTKYNSLYDGSFPAGQLEEYNFYHAVAAHIKGKRVLDLACGSGHYSLRLLDWGAESVVGVDISASMVAEARKRAGGRGNADFVVGDVTKSLDLGAPFDVVVGTWLLNYAANKEDMTAMFASVKANIQPGGSFFGLTIPPPLGSREELDRAFREDWASFGTDGWVTGEVERGFAVHTVLGMPGSGEKVGFDNFYLRNEVFEESCREAGFEGGLEWLPLVVDPASRSRFDLGRWNRLVLNPHFRISRA